MRVVDDIGGGRYLLLEECQLRATADPIQHPQSIQLGCQGHIVDRAPVAEQPEGCFVNLTVGLAVEIVRGDQVKDASDGGFIDQDGSQNCGLGSHIMRRGRSLQESSIGGRLMVLHNGTLRGEVPPKPPLAFESLRRTVALSGDCGSCATGAALGTDTWAGSLWRGSRSLL